MVTHSNPLSARVRENALIVCSISLHLRVALCDSHTANLGGPKPLGEQYRDSAQICLQMSNTDLFQCAKCSNHGWASALVLARRPGVRRPRTVFAASFLRRICVWPRKCAPSSGFGDLFRPLVPLLPAVLACVEKASKSVWRGQIITHRPSVFCSVSAEYRFCNREIV